MEPVLSFAGTPGIMPSDPEDYDDGMKFMEERMRQHARRWGKKIHQPFPSMDEWWKEAKEEY